MRYELASRRVHTVIATSPVELIATWDIPEVNDRASERSSGPVQSADN